MAGLRKSLADLKAEVERSRPARVAPSLDKAPDNLRRSEVIERGPSLPPVEEAAPRVQKNLRILKTDAQRMERLSRVGKISQTVLLSLALDAYEESLK